MWTTSQRPRPNVRLADLPLTPQARPGARRSVPMPARRPLAPWLVTHALLWRVK